MAGLQQEWSVIACIFLYLPHLFAVVCLLLCVLQHSAKFLHLQEHMCGQTQVAVARGGGGGGGGGGKRLHHRILNLSHLTTPKGDYIITLKEYKLTNRAAKT